MTRFLPTARALHAFALAALVPPFVATALIFVYIAIAFSQDLNSQALEPLLLYILATGLILSLGGCLAFGIPAHMLMQRLRRVGVWSYVALGLIGSIVVIAISAATSGQWIPTDGIDAAMVGLTIFGGPLAAWIFWRVARPDRIAT